MVLRSSYWSLHQQIQLYKLNLLQFINQFITNMQSSHKSFPVLDQQIDFLVLKIKQLKIRKQKDNPKSRFIIGVCGIPGSGKSTISRKICERLQHSVVLPMDGFHIARQFLTEQGIIRRGAAFTFNLDKFQQKIYQIKCSQIGQKIKYPDFDHKLKDPVQDIIQVSANTQIVIIQGLYVFDKNLKLNKQLSTSDKDEKTIWDLRIWVKSDLQTSINRVANRHLQSGIEQTYDLAYNRANTNDRTNALYVLNNCYDANILKEQNTNNFFKNLLIIENSIDTPN